MPNSSEEPPASSKASDQDLKDMDVLCTFKIQIKSQKMGVPKTSDHIPIKIKIPNPSQEPQHPPKLEIRTWIFFAPSKSR